MTTVVTQDVTNGDVTDASVMNSNFTAVKSTVNGGLDNANINAAAAIAISKLASYPADATKVLYGNGTWAVPTSSAPGYSVTLPGSPTDGQEHILVDSITLPTYQWRFRYNSGSAQTDKWEFVGGVPALSEVATAETTASTTYVALSTPGPSFTIPRAGQYLVEIGCLCGKSAGSADATVTMSYDIGATGAVDADSTVGTFSVAASGDHTVPTSASRARQKTIAAAATALVSKYKVSAATGSISARWMRVTPVRVS